MRQQSSAQRFILTLVFVAIPILGLAVAAPLLAIGLLALRVLYLVWFGRWLGSWCSIADEIQSKGLLDLTEALCSPTATGWAHVDRVVLWSLTWLDASIFLVGICLLGFLTVNIWVIAVQALAGIPAHERQSFF